MYPALFQFLSVFLLLTMNDGGEEGREEAKSNRIHGWFLKKNGLKQRLSRVFVLKNKGGNSKEMR